MIICTLKQVLDRKGWSRYRLQKESGISFPTIHALYHDKNKRYSAKVLDRLCWALECKVKDLLKYKPKRFPRTLK
jgi:DNA-binding Xre family transcriptional regulator